MPPLTFFRALSACIIAPLLYADVSSPDEALPGITPVESVAKHGNAPESLRRAKLDFSPAKATADHLLSTRVFDRSLAVIGSPTDNENIALANALQHYAALADPADHSPLEEFVRLYPKSAYTPSVQVQLARAYYRQGRYTLALATYESAWKLGKSARDRAGWTVAMDAAAGYVKMLSRVGRMDELESFFADPDAQRPMWGHAAEQIGQAREGLWLMKHRPQTSFRCGSLALVSLGQKNGLRLEQLKPALDAESTASGFSLAELEAIASAAGMPCTAIFVGPESNIPVPSVVHWKIGHYAAILGRFGDNYIVRDPTFGEGRDIQLSPTALREEASGYYLVLQETGMAKGWSKAEDAAKQSITGRGQTYGNNPDGTRNGDPEHPCSGGNNSPGMATHAIKSMLVSLTVRDTPAFYAVPYGPEMVFTVTYNERENNELTDGFSNFGPRWSFNWLAWINEEDTGYTPYSFKLGAAGGGAVSYEYIDTPAGGDPGLDYYKSNYDQTVSTRVETGFYRIEQPDGSIREYSHPVGVAANRPVLLTRVTDPAGNAAVLAYDSLDRLETITDAAGNITAFSYDLSAWPNRITQIELPGGRSALFRYDANGFLEEIEDMIGIVSRVTYGSSQTPDRVTTLTTPYGDTNFAYGESSSFYGPSRYRWVEVTDPLGQRERVEFNERTDIGIPYEETDATLLPAMPLRNAILYGRNSFVWSKKAFTLAPTLAASSPSSPANTPSLGTSDYAAAHVLHWIHSPDYYSADDHLESETRPEESRIWYNYPGQYLEGWNGVEWVDYGTLFESPSAYFYAEGATVPGTSRQPSRVGRVVPDPTGAIDPVTNEVGLVSQIYSYAYNDQGHVTRSRDPEGRELRYTYAANGRDLVKLEQVVARHPTDPNPSTWTYQSLLEIDWDSGLPSRPAAITDAARQTTSYTYNAAGQLLTVTNALNETTAYGYHPTGQGITPATILDSAATGYLVRIDGPLAGSADTQHLTWDAQGRLASHTDESGYTLSYAYDALDRLILVTYPDSSTEEIFYDKLDPELLVDRAGRITQRTYDALRRLRTVTDPAQRVTEYVWCDCGSLAQLIDAAGRSTRFEYDVNGRLTHRHYEGDAPSGPTNTHAYAYDLAGRLSRHTDPRGQITDYRHTLDDRIAAILHTGSVEPTPDTHYTHDPVFPRIAQVQDRLGGTPVSTIDYAYHPITAPTGTLGAGRLASVTGPLADATLTYAYDEIGRVTSRTLPGQTETWTFDALGRLDTATNPLGAFVHAYDGASPRLATMTRAGGLAMSLAYRPAGEDFGLETLAHRRPDLSVVAGNAYQRDPLRNLITGWTQTRPDALADTWDFAYTEADELQTARSIGASPADHAYVYDAGGNRRSEQAGAGVRQWTVNGRNQLVEENPGGTLRVAASFNTAPEGDRAWLNGREVALDAEHRLDTLETVNAGAQTLSIRAQDADTGGFLVRNWQVTVPSFAPKTFSYDANGNLTTIEQGGVVTRFYRWDARDRLVAWGSGTTVEGRFEYDSLGRRIREQDGSDATVRQWVWGDNPQPLQERDGAGSVTRRYFAQGERRLVGGVEVSRYYTRDHLGSVRAVVDADNALIASYAFDPFGRRTQLQGTETHEVAFTGHYYHATTGLHLTLFRAYDAETGRWLSRDPLEEEDGPNIYAYVKNDPVNHFDPDGRFAQAAVVRWSAGEVIAAGAAAVLMWDAMREESLSRQALEETLRGIEARRAQVCEASRGTGERGIAGKDPNPWKGYRPRDPKNPQKGGEKRDPQTGKWKPVPRPEGPPPPNHPEW